MIGLTNLNDGPDRLGEGWAKLEAAEWQAARSAFEDALATNETPEAFEGLSWAAWWLDDAETVFGARERAFRLYREQGRPAAAARLATWLGADELDFNGAHAVAAGWLSRARRLLEPEPPGPAHGWLAFHEGYIVLGQGHTGRAAQLAVRAAGIGREFGVPDLEMLGLALEGAVHVECARTAEGMRCLDEATVIALEGSATIPISAAWTCCFLVSACETVRDHTRALEWCDRIADFAERYGSRYMLGFCRAHYGALYRTAGRWEEAESQLEAAITAYEGSRRPYVAGVRVELAELRRRQGRWDDAERLLDEAGAGSAAMLCGARLALDRDDPATCVELADRCLRRIRDERAAARIPALELLVIGYARQDDLPLATAAMAELRQAERSVGTTALRAAADLADGVLAATRNDHEAARRLLEDARDAFDQCGAPFEAASARLELARALVSLGRIEAAAAETTAAREVFAALGAEAAVRRASRMVARTRESGPHAALPALTRRECDVLRLVARGMTNREIAEQLTISEHTVHRHVAHILRKLDLPSRTAAAAHAVSAGLIDPART